MTDAIAAIWAQSAEASAILREEKTGLLASLEPFKRDSESGRCLSTGGTLQLRRRLARQRAKVMLISKNEPKPVGARCDSNESKLHHLAFIVKKPSRLPESSLLLPRFLSFRRQVAADGLQLIHSRQWGKVCLFTLIEISKACVPGDAASEALLANTGLIRTWI